MTKVHTKQVDNALTHDLERAMRQWYPGLHDAGVTIDDRAKSEKGRSVEVGTIWGPARPDDPLLSRIGEDISAEQVERLLPRPEESAQRARESVADLAPIQIRPETLRKQLGKTVGGT